MLVAHRVQIWPAGHAVLGFGETSNWCQYVILGNNASSFEPNSSMVYRSTTPDGLDYSYLIGYFYTFLLLAVLQVCSPGLSSAAMQFQKALPTWAVFIST